jgi:hypothetical protein
MNKFAISLIALAALSTAALASGNRSWDLRDSDTYMGKYATQLQGQSAGSNALAVSSDVRPATNFERLKKISEENDQTGH